MDPYIKERVHEALEKTSRLIRHKHSILEEEQAAYVDTIITRISNALLEDLVDRVGRAPHRKLSRKERFIGPASKLAELEDKYDALMGGVEMALKFQNIPG
jgi:mannitol-1-phosphate 5-dehydrogenase